MAGQPGPDGLFVVLHRARPDPQARCCRGRVRAASATPARAALKYHRECADDRLWAEVLSLGGYNVLPKPFKTDEVFREVGLAWLSWKSKQLRQRAARS